MSPLCEGLALQIRVTDQAVGGLQGRGKQGLLGMERLQNRCQYEQVRTEHGERSAVLPKMHPMHTYLSVGSVQDAHTGPPGH